MNSRNFRKYLSLGLLALALSPLSSLHAEEIYVEPGRHGLQWSVTEDTVFMGYAYRSDWLDVSLHFSGHSFIDGARANYYPINWRVGYRFNLGSHNYLAAGLLVNVALFGSDYGSGIAATFNNTKSVQGVTGVNIAGAGRVGPYIAIQRHFAHSGVFLELAVMPFAYQNNIMNDGQGNKVTSTGLRFMESGYVSVGYLFGTSGDDLKKTD